MASYMMGDDMMGAFLPGLKTQATQAQNMGFMPGLKIQMAQAAKYGLQASPVLKKAARAAVSTLRARRRMKVPVATINQAVISAAMFGDDFLGGKRKFLPGLFSAKLAKKTLAKFDPTSSTAKYGKAMKAGIIGGLNFIPVIGTGLSVAAGVGFMAKSGVDQARRNKQAQAAQQQAIIQNAENPTPASPEVGPGETGTGEKPKSAMMPLLGIGAAAVAALTML